MHESDAATYGDSVADIYDQRLTTSESETALTVDFLATQIAQCGGPVLELGIGTGRVAIPLAARGFAVHGVDSSAKMLARLRAKPGGADITASVDDFARLAGLATQRFGVVFVVFNTLFALTTQDAQLACFNAVAQRLLPGGRFIVQAFVPDLERLAKGQYAEVRSVDVDSVRVNLTRCDLATQTLSMMHLVIDAAGTHLYPVPMRYAFPSELDLMARIAGLRLRERWSSWTGEPFVSESRSHISVYERAAIESA